MRRCVREGRRGSLSTPPPSKSGVRSGLRPQRAFLSATALLLAPPSTQWRGNTLGARSRSRLVAVVRCGFRRGVGAAFAGGRNLPPPALGSASLSVGRRSYCRPSPSPAATPHSLLFPLSLGRAPRIRGLPCPRTPAPRYARNFATPRH